MDIQISMHCDMTSNVPGMCTAIGPGVETSDEGQITTSIFNAASPSNYYWDSITVNAGLEKLTPATATPGASDTTCKSQHFQGVPGAYKC